MQLKMLSCEVVVAGLSWLSFDRAIFEESSQRYIDMTHDFVYCWHFWLTNWVLTFL